MKRRIYLVASVVWMTFMGACSTVSLHDYHGATIRFNTPCGWIVQPLKPGPGFEHMCLLSPKNQTQRNDPGITVDYYGRFDPRFPHTQEGLAQSYLKGTHDIMDPNVRLESVGSFETRHGRLNIYRYQSDYFGDHLVVLILGARGYVHLELWARSRDQWEPFLPALEALTRSVSIEEKIYR